MAEVKEFLDYAGLKTYDGKIKEFAQEVADKVKNDLIDGAPDTYVLIFLSFIIFPTEANEIAKETPLDFLYIISYNNNR